MLLRRSWDEPMAVFDPLALRSPRLAMSETLALSRGLPSTIREGEILGGKYRLEREIGRGSMGTVWSAVHLTLGQRVAIKLIAAEYAQAADARKRFSTEAKAAARLRSRYVVQVYDDGETPAGTPYIVLEYLEGETLEQRLAREHNLPFNDAVRITRHVGRALSRAHAQGIVHRDLKPGNVFLARTEDEELGWVAKVLDFGIAKLEEQGVASTTKTGTLLGTPLFMSPEQVHGSSSVDARSDLYSLGMVFYNMLTGTFAFAGESFTDVLVAICSGVLPDLRVAAPWAPASVADWFQRACARDVTQRFQSADEMIEALEVALGVSTGAYSRQSASELKLDTLRGHAPPVAHAVPRATQLESGEFTKGSTQVLGVDPALLQSSALGVARREQPTLVIPKSSQWPLWLGAGVLLLALLGVFVFVFVRGRAAHSSAEEAASASGDSSAVLPPSPPATAASAPAASAPAASAPAASAPAASAPAASAPAASAPAASAPAASASAATATASTPPRAVPSQRPAAAAGGPIPPVAVPRPPSHPSPRPGTTTDMGF